MLVSLGVGIHENRCQDAYPCNLRQGYRDLASWKANRALTRVRHVKPTQLKFKLANWKASRALTI